MPEEERATFELTPRETQALINKQREKVWEIANIVLEATGETTRQLRSLTDRLDTLYKKALEIRDNA